MTSVTNERIQRRQPSIKNLYLSLSVVNVVLCGRVSAAPPGVCSYLLSDTLDSWVSTPSPFSSSISSFFSLSTYVFFPAYGAVWCLASVMFMDAKIHTRIREVAVDDLSICSHGVAFVTSGYECGSCGRSLPSKPSGRGRPFLDSLVFLFLRFIFLFHHVCLFYFLLRFFLSSASGLTLCFFGYVCYAARMDSWGNRRNTTVFRSHQWIKSYSLRIISRRFSLTQRANVCPHISCLVYSRGEICCHVA